jgi:hypothetical protein
VLAEINEMKVGTPGIRHPIDTKIQDIQRLGSWRIERRRTSLWMNAPELSDPRRRFKGAVEAKEKGQLQGWTRERGARWRGKGQ